jgi:hypothetical protein
MKTVEFSIENMANARDALNNALAQAMTIMQQKNVSQATVGLTLELEMRQDGMLYSWTPAISYKTSVRVPLDIKDTGRVTGMSQVYWDQEAGGYVIRIEGEQVRIE